MTAFHVLSHDGQRPWQGRNGSFIDHNLTVSDGEQERRVYLTQKPETPDPEVGSVIHGYLEQREVKKRDGTYFTKTKLCKDSGPRGGAPPPPTATPDQATPDNATPKVADRGSTFDERSARIERQHSQEMAIRMLAIVTGPQVGGSWDIGETRKLLANWTDWFCADLNNASPKQPNTAISPPADAGAGSTREEGVARRPAPAEASRAQKAAVTRELNAKVAKDHHDALRKAAKADTKDGASALIDGLRKMDAVELLTRYGITPASDVPWDDDGGLPPASEVEQVAAAAGLGIESDEPPF